MAKSEVIFSFRHLSRMWSRFSLTISKILSQIIVTISIYLESIRPFSTLHFHSIFTFRWHSIVVKCTLTVSRLSTILSWLVNLFPLSQRNSLFLLYLTSKNTCVSCFSLFVFIFSVFVWLQANFLSGCCFFLLRCPIFIVSFSY